MLTAADLMTGTPTTIKVTSSVAQATRALDELAVRHLPVVNEDDELVGMLSDRDLRGMPWGSPATRDLIPAAPPPGAPVGDVMSSLTVDVGPSTRVGELAAAMIENRIGAVPVVDNEGHVIGIVSYVDILRALAREEPPAPSSSRPPRRPGTRQASHARRR